MTSAADRLWAVVEPYLSAEGVELDDLEIVGKAPGVVVRVTLDAAEPLGVDQLADLSRRLSRLLDDEDPISSSYTLEVSSPGLERKLRRPRHYQKSVGRDVKIKDIGRVVPSHREREILTRTDGQESVQLDIFKEADANLVALAHRVHAALGEFDIEKARAEATEKKETSDREA